MNVLLLFQVPELEDDLPPRQQDLFVRGSHEAEVVAKPLLSHFAWVRKLLFFFVFYSLTLHG